MESLSWIKPVLSCLAPHQSLRKTLDVISGKEKSLASEVDNFTERVPPGDYNLILMFKGDAVRQLVRGNASNFFNFYLAAYGTNASNPSYYVEIVLMNFIKRDS